jgi:mannose-1-phosphate guanylyltransferase
MIMVIIAGGSGTRLWPLSTPDFPKHLLKINGDKLSLLQHTYERALQLSDTIYVVSEVSQAALVKQQLNELPDEAFIVEPGRRGTSNCIIAALAYIGEKHNANEPIAFTHADHYIRDTAGFVHSFRAAAQTTVTQSRIVLVGVEADYPATGFGYIEKGDLLSDEPFVYNVRSFKEKPDYETAKAYVDSGEYLWNGGYFVATANTFLTAMQRYAPDLAKNWQKLARADSTTYEQTYLGFTSAAIDYALIEKVEDLLVVPASFDWLDLGSYSDLARAVNGDAQGNHLVGDRVEVEEVSNTFIHNEETKPVVVIGLDNVVIVNTANGLLVTRKDLSQKVGDVSKRLLPPAS